MRRLVRLEIGLLVKAPVTLGALVPLLLRVRQLVRGQRGGPGEGLEAHGADEGLSVAVRCQMLLQGRVLAE